MEHWTSWVIPYGPILSWTAEQLCWEAYVQNRNCFLVLLIWLVSFFSAMSYICLNKYLAWSFRNRTGLHETVAWQVLVLSLHCSGHQKPWGWGDVMLCSQLQDVQCLPVLCKVERTEDSSQLCYFCKMLKYLVDSNPKSKANGSPAKISISCYFQNNIFKITFLEDSVNISIVWDLFIWIYIPKSDLLLLVQPNPDLDCLSDMHWLASWSIRLKSLFLTLLQQKT